MIIKTKDIRLQFQNTFAHFKISIRVFDNRYFHKISQKLDVFQIFFLITLYKTIYL